MKAIKLHPVTTRNGETRWCGPSIISSITGIPVADITRVIKDQRIASGYGHHTRILNLWNDEGDIKEVQYERSVQGTYKPEVKKCLNHYGFDLVRSANQPKGKPTISQWLKQRADRSECNLVNAGNHWQLVQGIYFVDSWTKVPVIVSVAPHQRSRVITVYKVVRLHV